MRCNEKTYKTVEYSEVQQETGECVTRGRARGGGAYFGGLRSL